VTPSPRYKHGGTAGFRTLTHRYAVPPLPKGEGCYLYFPALSLGERVAEGRVRGQTAISLLTSL
jgi:hypothetical protein